MAIFNFSSCSEEPTVKSADLVFVLEMEADNSAQGMSSAIIQATGSGDFSATHVGLIAIIDDKVKVIDASPAHGVSMRDLSEFEEENLQPDEGRTKLVFMRVKDLADPEKVVSRAMTYIGKDYDYTFLSENDSYYCSEFIQNCFTDEDGNSLFPSKPMNFQNENGDFPEYWKSLFSRLGMDIPQGEPGTNPNDMMYDERLVYLKSYLKSFGANSKRHFLHVSQE